MNREDIIRIAQETDFIIFEIAAIANQSEEQHTADALTYVMHEMVMRFAFAIAAAEREECAKVCDRGDPMVKAAITQTQCAAAIRARGK